MFINFPEETGELMESYVELSVFELGITRSKLPPGSFISELEILNARSFCLICCNNFFFFNFFNYMTTIPSSAPSNSSPYYLSDS